jgi:DNA-binding transcriptional LysR family regulator
MNKKEMVLLSALARTGSVTRSASAAGVSPPAANAMLARLEDRLGGRLFTRDQQLLVQTAECRALIPEVSHALAALEAVDRAAESLGRGKRRRIVVGTVPAVSTCVLPKAVKALLSEQPETAILFKAGTVAEVLEMAEQEHIDLGLIYGSALLGNVCHKELGEMELMCVMPYGHAYADLWGVSVERLMATPYISLSRHLPVGAHTAEAIEAEGGVFSPNVEVTQFSDACAMVEAGCGVAVLENLAAAYVEARGLIAKPFAAAPSLSLGAIWSRTKGLSEIATELLEHIEAVKDTRTKYSPF